MLTDYLAADGDTGDDYCKLTLLKLTTQSLAGPGQVLNSFRRDTEVANQPAARQQGGEVGNLLTLLVGGGLL